MDIDEYKRLRFLEHIAGKMEKFFLAYDNTITMNSTVTMADNDIQDYFDGLELYTNVTSAMDDPIIIHTNTGLGELRCKVSWNGRISDGGVVRIRAQNRPSYEVAIDVDHELMVTCCKCVWEVSDSTTVAHVRNIVNYTTCRKILEFFTSDIVFADDDRYRP